MEKGEDLMIAQSLNSSSFLSLCAPPMPPLLSELCLTHANLVFNCSMRICLLGAMVNVPRVESYLIPTIPSAGIYQAVLEDKLGG